MAVVERDVRRRPHDDEHARPVDAEGRRHGRVGLEAGEVVLLLQAGVAPHLRGPGAERPQALAGDRVGDDDARRRPAAEPVLDARELVVERVGGGDAERPRGQRQLVRGVRERDVEPPSARPAPQVAEPLGHRDRLAQRVGPAVRRADDVVVDTSRGEQLERLRVVPRGHLDLGAALPQQPEQRPEEGDVGRVGDVDPDAHPRDRTRSVCTEADHCGCMR